MQISFSAPAGAAASINDVNTGTDLLLSGIIFAPGRTIQISAGDGMRLIQQGRLWLLEFDNIGFRFGEAGSTSTMYFGLPSYVPRVYAPIATSGSWTMMRSGTNWANQLLAADTYDTTNFRQCVQMTFLTTALVAANWPITPAAHAFIRGQIFFQTQT